MTKTIIIEKINDVLGTFGIEKFGIYKAEMGKEIMKIAEEFGEDPECTAYWALVGENELKARMKRAADAACECESPEDAAEHLQLALYFNALWSAFQTWSRAWEQAQKENPIWAERWLAEQKQNK